MTTVPSASPRAGRRSVEELEGTALAGHLDEVLMRLVAHYHDGHGLTEDVVRTEFSAAAHRFDGAAVRLFLPILVERGARRRLDALTEGRPVLATPVPAPDTDPDGRR